MKKITLIIWIFLIAQSAFAVDSESKNIAQNEQNTSVCKKENKQKSKAKFFKRTKKKRKIIKRVRRFLN